MASQSNSEVRGPSLVFILLAIIVILALFAT